MARQRVVVAGAGLAALRTAEALRANDYTGDIVVVGDEVHRPYNRPPLSKDVLTAGEPPVGPAVFRQRQSVDDAQWVLGRTVTRVDLNARFVELDTGEPLAYDALVVATGVSPRRLPSGTLPATPSTGRHAIRSHDDAVALRDALVEASSVVVLGAGFIGCEVAASATVLGRTVTCVAADARPMIRPLGEHLGRALQALHEAHGVRFRLNTSVERLSGTGCVAEVELTDGTCLPAGLVVEALGSRCNTALLDGQGLDLTDGVLVDNALRPVRDETGIDGVAVVGDVARFPNPRFGNVARRVEHWSVPSDTGRRAGATLAAYLRGEGYTAAVAEPWTFVPSFWSTQYGTRIASFGMPGLADEDGICVLEGDLAGECIVGYHRDSTLVGVVGIGMAGPLNAYRDQVGDLAAIGLPGRS